MEKTMNRLLKIYSTCLKLPFGKRIFSKIVCLQAPYFGTIKPIFQELKAGYCEITFKNRRSVHNHIKSVHAIAMCNLAELIAGTLMEASLPKNMRWIPSGMTVKYIKIARSNLKGSCELDVANLTKSGPYPLSIDVKDENNEIVFNAVITLHLSEKKKKNI
jgi:acyl-coenzyme A thioesterase PaaI-like protein